MNGKIPIEFIPIDQAIPLGPDFSNLTRTLHMISPKSVCRKIYFTVTPDSQKTSVSSNWYRVYIYLGEIGFSYSWEVMNDFTPDLLLLFAKHCPQQPLNFIS